MHDCQTNLLVNATYMRSYATDTFSVVASDRSRVRTQQLSCERDSVGSVLRGLRRKSYRPVVTQRPRVSNLEHVVEDEAWLARVVWPPLTSVEELPELSANRCRERVGAKRGGR